MSFSDIAGTLLGSMAPGGGLLSGIGKVLSPSQNAKPKMIPDAPDPKKITTAKPNSFDKGGRVEKTGLALVHKGEHVIPVSAVKQASADTQPEEKNKPTISHHRVVMGLKNGQLNRALGISEESKIPADKLQAARNSKNPHVKEMANLLHSLAHFNS